MYYISTLDLKYWLIFLRTPPWNMKYTIKYEGESILWHFSPPNPLLLNKTTKKQLSDRSYYASNCLLLSKGFLITHLTLLIWPKHFWRLHNIPDWVASLKGNVCNNMVRWCWYVLRQYLREPYLIYRCLCGGRSSSIEHCRPLLPLYQRVGV